MLFHLVVHKDQDSAYGVTVSALKGCFSAGDTLEEAVSNTKEAILFHLEGLLEDGIEPTIHNPTLDDLKANADYQDGLLVSVDIDVSQYTLKPERFNVSWSKNILRQVDRYVAKTHDNRSNFLAKSALFYMKDNKMKTTPVTKLQMLNFHILVDMKNNTDVQIDCMLAILDECYGINASLDNVHLLNTQYIFISKNPGTYSITKKVDPSPTDINLNVSDFLALHGILL